MSIKKVLKVYVYNSLSINELRGAGQPRSRNSLILRELQGLTRRQKETPSLSARGCGGFVLGLRGKHQCFLLLDFDCFDHGSVSCDLVKH